MPGSSNWSRQAGARSATRTIQHRRPPLRKKARTAGPSSAYAGSLCTGSQAITASEPNTATNCVASSTGTGTPMGPDAAKPTNPVMSIRGSTSGAGGGRTSNSIPGSLAATVLAVAVTRSAHLQPLVGHRQLLHGHVGPFGVQRAADVLDDPGAEQLPRLNDLSVILTLELNRDGAQSLLVTVA